MRLLIFVLLHSYISLLILDQKTGQTSYFKDFTFRSDKLQKNISNFQVIIELNIGVHDYSKSIPVLMYCPTGFPSGIMSLHMIQQMAQSTSAICLLDGDAVLENTGTQILTLSSFPFPSKFSQQFSKTSLQITMGQIYIGVFLIQLDQDENQAANYQLAIHERQITNTIDDCEGLNTFPAQAMVNVLEHSNSVNVWRVGSETIVVNRLVSYTHPLSYRIQIYIDQKITQTYMFDLRQIDLTTTNYLVVQAKRLPNYLGELEFGYQCLGSNPNLPFFSNQFKDDYTLLGDQLLDELELLVDYQAQTITNCRKSASSATSILGVMMIPYFLIQFHNPNQNLIQFQLQIDSQNFGGQQSVSISAIYIITIVLGVLILGIIVVVWCRNRSQSPNSQPRRAAPSQVSVAERAHKLKELNAQACNKYMPTKQYANVLLEFPEIQEIIECLVCLTAWEPLDQVRVTTCFHLFHQHCLDQWLTRHQTCPFCRISLNRKALKEAADFYSQQDVSEMGSHKNIQVPRGSEVKERRTSSVRKISINMRGVDSSQKITNQNSQQKILDNDYTRRMRQKRTSIQSILQDSSEQSIIPIQIITKLSPEVLDSKPPINKKKKTSSLAQQLSNADRFIDINENVPQYLLPQQLNTLAENSNIQLMRPDNFSDFQNSNMYEGIQATQNGLQSQEMLMIENISQSSDESREIHFTGAVKITRNGSHLGTIQEARSRDEQAQSRLGASPFSLFGNNVDRRSNDINEMPVDQFASHNSAIKLQKSYTSETPSKLAIIKSKSDNVPRPSQFAKKKEQIDQSSQQFDSADQLQLVRFASPIAEEDNQSHRNSLG